MVVSIDKGCLILEPDDMAESFNLGVVLGKHQDSISIRQFISDGTISVSLKLSKEGMEQRQMTIE